MLKIIFYIIVAAWVLNKLFGNKSVVNYYFNVGKTETSSKKNEGEKRISKQVNSPGKRKVDEGEYVDYEEVK